MGQQQHGAAAQGVTRIGMCRARGADLRMASNDEDLTPEEVDRIAADLSYNQAKHDGSLRRREEERALDAQMQRVNQLEHLR